ncbi:MAG: exodeoxyribonuclease III [Rhodospirillales bacterium]|jgi:exodeoxyribonuclease III|nr:exodeoxyribonuclease III [Rhodospirillales bacterium]
MTSTTSIATWNVNSIKARLPRAVEWLKEFSPDIVLLQELKCVSEAFPLMEIEDLGYNVATAGQKTYNGVAILSKSPIEVELTKLPGDASDEQARYIEAFTAGIRVASIYLPNGNPTRDEDGNDHEKFLYKLGWMDRLNTHVKGLLKHDEAIVLGGDYNLAPADVDVFDPKGLADEALCRPESRARFRTLMNMGLTNAIDVSLGIGSHYSYWDYQRGAWNKDNGLRIDHLLLSPQAADRFDEAGIDKGPRAKEKASDHTPVWCTLR